MTNLPFNTNPNVPNLQQPMVGQPPYGGYNQQYNPPPPTITFSIIEGRQAVDNFLVGTNVTAFLADFTNMKLYVKERDPNNILKPIRIFGLSDETPQPQPVPPVNGPQNQNEEKFSAMQTEMNELKQMVQALVTSQQNNTPQQNFNKNKGGKN